MQKSLRVVVAAATISVAFSALVGIAAAGGPKPHYTMSCAVGAGASTSVTWQHEKLDQITLEWSAPAGSGVTFDPRVNPVLSPTPPHGSLLTATPSGAVLPVSVTATFRHVDGSTDQLTADCS